MDEIEQLKAGLRSADVTVRRRSAEQLAQLESGARGAAAVLAAACDENDETVREWTVAALEAVGPPLPEQQAEIIQLLASSCALSRYWAATLLGRLSTEATAAAVPPLVQTLKADDDLAVRERAAWALGELGPLAAPAKEGLRDAAASEHKRLSRLAQHALEAIGA